MVRHLLGDKDDFQAIIIFCSTKKKVVQLARKLAQKGYACQCISSDYEQDAREEALSDFRSGKIRIMVATDVMSRGIDIKGIDLVINYDVPGDAEDYVHRIGRTARAKTEGMAITLVSADDMFKFSKIERLIDRTLEKDQPPSELGEGPQWNGPSQGKKGRGKGSSSSSNRGDSSRKNGSSDSKTKGSTKTEGTASGNDVAAKKSGNHAQKSKSKDGGKSRDNKPKSKHRLLFESLPNPKQKKES